MRLPLLQAAVALGVLVGCADQSSIKPAEILDERTGVTVGALREPIELVEDSQAVAPGSSKRASFAYLGPLEWDRMGEITYGLWLHVAPGNDTQVSDIHLPGAATLNLDDGPLVLTPVEARALPSGPYQPVVSWGQTGYFELNVAMLQRMAASAKLTLDFRAVDGGVVKFIPSNDTHKTLTEYLKARGLSD
jgi:hypothetical protein